MRVILKIKKYFLFVLILQIFLTSFINFFHTERIITKNKNCLACQFLKSFYLENEIEKIFIPQPTLISTLKPQNTPHYIVTHQVFEFSRAPPFIAI